MLTALTMMFFAANSLLARLALRADAIDAASFTAIRLASGAAALSLLSRERGGSMRAAVVLVLYAIAFSYAYLLLNASTGSLVLFAFVQMTMLGVGIARGEHPPPMEWVGLAAAFGGLVYLVFPGLTAPSPLGVVLMAGAGIGWGAYSLLLAKSAGSPLAANAGNFLRAAPMALVFVLSAAKQLHVTWTGAALAAISGAITSGLGYVMWSIALKRLRSSQAAVVQLTVPVLAAVVGVVLLGEPLTSRLVVASVAILGGVAIAVETKVN